MSKGGSRIIIVGASGMIGSALFAAAKVSGQQVIGTCNSHANKDLLHFDMLTDHLGSIIKDINPDDTIFLLSAYTNVGWIFENQQKASELNLIATKRLIDELSQAGARIIFMSSVEVFDGEQGNYNERSLPNPLTVYGRMKFEIEQYLISKKCRFCIVRTGWNVGWDIKGHCGIKLTYKTLINPGAKMAKDNILSIVDVNDTVDGLLKIVQKPQITVCHFASKPSLARTELATMIMNASKHKQEMSFETVLFSDIRFSEKRSRNTQIDNSFAISDLGINFKSPHEIVRQKVELLDQFIDQIRLS